MGTHLVFAITEESTEVTLHIFYGEGCPHCGKALESLIILQNEYPTLVVEEHETYFDNQERELFHQIAQYYNYTIEGVPTIFIDNKILVGFDNNVEFELKEIINNCSIFGCEDPLQNVNTNNKIKLQKLTVPAVLSAALVDAINPCAFAVLIILMSTILVSKNKKKALFAGLAFSSSIFISYFLMGIGLYTAIQATGISHTFYLIVAILAIFIGIFNLKDFLWYGKWFKMEVPDSWRPKMKSLLKSVTSVPGAFSVGFVVSLFLLPCTSGPYIVILGLLSQATTKSYAIFLLLLYNLIFISPMILINLGIFFGFTTTEKAEKFRQKKLKILHLIAGIIILVLGIGMLIAIKLGMV